MIVLEGSGILIINGIKYQIKHYDSAFITLETHDRLINTGATPFKITWSYATVDVARTLVDD